MVRESKLKQLIKSQVRLIDCYDAQYHVLACLCYTGNQNGNLLKNRLIVTKSRETEIRLLHKKESERAEVPC